MLLDGIESDESHYFRTEDAEDLKRILKEGTFHAVVANPPYITPKDTAARDAYRRLYSTCYGKYSLSVPFMERVFRLSCSEGEHSSGYCGQITSNSFTKREFGTMLVEEFLPSVDVYSCCRYERRVSPWSWSTPTLIMFGRNRRPLANTIRAVMGIRGEPDVPRSPEKGVVWTSIIQMIDHTNSQNGYVKRSRPASPLRLRNTLGHPGRWRIRVNVAHFSGYSFDSGRASGVNWYHVHFTLEDEAYFLPCHVVRRSAIRNQHYRPVAEGDELQIG